ncbi:hypothetical protein REPUB_Repub20aG0002000 [Reevesia pubescens]
MGIFSVLINFSLAAARHNFLVSSGAGFIVFLLPSEKVEGAVVPLIFKGHASAFRLLIIGIVFTFLAALSALVIGDDSAIARSCTFCSLITMVVAILILAYVFLPDFFWCLLLMS